MKPLTLIARPENSNEKILASISCISNNLEICKISADGNIETEVIMNLAELETVYLVAKNFDLFFNNIITES